MDGMAGLEVAAQPGEAQATAQGGVAWVAGVGPSNGLGAALARRFAAAGLTVVLTGRTPARLEVCAAEIREAGGKAVAAPGNVTREADLLAILDRISLVGSLEAAIFNAGNNHRKPTLDMESAFFEEMWRTICLGGFMFGRGAIRKMLEQGRGTLLFTGASASLRGRPTFTAFAAAKAGLRSVSQSMAREFGPQGIHVAHIVIDGLINGERVNARLPGITAERGPDGLLGIDAIADAYWFLHTQPRSAWTQELDLRPYKEPF